MISHSLYVQKKLPIRKNLTKSPLYGKIELDSLLYQWGIVLSAPLHVTLKSRGGIIS